MKIVRTRNKEFFAIAISLFAFACNSSSVEKEGSALPASEPVLPEGQRIEKAINVSFSTYSTDWPVGWEWIDPEEKYNATPHDVKKGVLRIRIPAKKNLNLENNTAPRYLKSITGDFQIETRVKFLPKANYQGAGLLIFRDQHNYIKFERAYGGGGGGEGLRIDARRGSSFNPILTPNDIQTDVAAVELKIARKGNMFVAYWRIDPKGDWKEAGEFISDYPETILAGLVACNTAEEITAEFSYIRLLPYSAP